VASAVAAATQPNLIACTLRRAGWRQAIQASRTNHSSRKGAISGSTKPASWRVADRTTRTTISVNA